MLDRVFGVRAFRERGQPANQIVIVVRVVRCQLLNLLLQDPVQSLLHLVFVDNAALVLVDAVELLEKKTSKLGIVLDFVIHDAAVDTFVDLLVVLTDEGVQENFVVERVHGRLLLLLLQHEKARENALLDGAMNESSDLFLRQCLVLNNVFQRWFIERNIS